MPLNFEELQLEALKLEPTQRRRLAEILLTSLDASNPAQAEGTTIALAEKRFQDYVDGKLQAVPADQVFKDVATQLS